VIWLIVALIVVYAAILLTLGLCGSAKLGDEQIELAKRGRERVIDPSLGDAPTRPPDPGPAYELGHRVHAVDGRRVYEVRR
jgi:hypothetical protein